MNAGRTVKLDGRGTFYYTPNTQGQSVDTAEGVSAKQIIDTRQLHTRNDPCQQQSGYDLLAGE